MLEIVFSFFLFFLSSSPFSPSSPSSSSFLFLLAPCSLLPPSSPFPFFLPSSFPRHFSSLFSSFDLSLHHPHYPPLPLTTLPFPFPSLTTLPFPYYPSLSPFLPSLPSPFPFPLSPLPFHCCLFFFI